MSKISVSEFGILNEIHDGSKIIICKPWDQRGDRAVKGQCELCGMDVSAFPASIERCAEDPEFHLVCTPKCTQELIRKFGPMQHRGRITDNQFVKQKGG
jgi:hypothetical protein